MLTISVLTITEVVVEAVIIGGVVGGLVGGVEGVVVGVVAESEICRASDAEGNELYKFVVICCNYAY